MRTDADTIECITVEALLPDGSAWRSYRFPLPGEAEESPADPRSHMIEAARKLGDAAQKESVELGNPAIRFTQHSMPRGEHYREPVSS